MDSSGASEAPPGAPTDALAELAGRYGIATEYTDWLGRHVTVSTASIRAVLAALGVAASDDAAVVGSLRAHDELAWRRALPASVVCRQGAPTRVAVHVPHGSAVRLEIQLEDGTSLAVEQGERQSEPRLVDGREVGEATFDLRPDLPLGWHRLVVHTLTETEDPTATATLIVTPARLALPPALREGRVWGLMHQVYQARSAESWGLGDLGDLSRLVDWAGRDLGADFVLVNPLHAAEPVPPMAASPYLPTTRRFVNPVYLKVEDVPGYAELDPSARRRIEELASEARTHNQLDTIDRDVAWAAKRAALHEIYTSTEGADEFARFRAEEGEGLATFATWCALAEEHGLPWAEWPSDLQDPGSPAVARFRESRAEAVGFHEWLQWQLRRQLAGVQQDALAAGMSLGLVHDLAVGVHPGGADAWGLGDALARGVTVGAPPDQFNQLGQNWSQPPWRPDRLAELGYAPYRDMLRTVLKDAGGIRVDHIIGLFRLWWIPEGATPDEGTYVYYDHEALIGILALEAQRAGAVVVGEDLGVVEPAAREYMLERGVLGTSILWFERDEQGALRAPETYRELCLSTVTTHDIPPTAGYLGLEHVTVRDRLGLLTRPAEEERAVELETVAKVRAALVSAGLLDHGADVAETVAAMHAFIARTPSKMLGVAVPDLVGDVRAVNQPGTDEEYPNWRVPLSGPDGRPVSLEDLMASPLAAAIAERLNA